MKRDEFRRLVEGEVVLPTDECLHESGEWRPVQGYIGKPAPDPKYTAHCQFRRRETEGAELRPDPKAEILTRLDEHLSEAGHEFQPMYCAFCYSYQQTFWKISQNPTTASPKSRRGLCSKGCERLVEIRSTNFVEWSR